MMVSPSSRPRLATLALLCAFSVVPLNIFLPSLPNIAATFDVDYALVALSLAAYTAMAAATEMVTGPLSDRFGRRPVLLICLGLFTIGSIGCAMADSIWVFLGFRLVQAAITTCYPVAAAIIKDTTADDQVASRLGYAISAAAIAPMIAPGIGGLLDEVGGWRSIFWFLAACGAGTWVWCVIALPETNQNRTGGFKSHWRAYRTILAEPRFWAYALCLAFSSGCFYAYLAGMPLAAGTAFGLSTAMLGLYMGSTTFGYFAGSFLAGRYAGQVAIPPFLIMARCIVVAGPVIALALYVGGLAVHPLALFLPCMLVGLGNGLTGPGASAGAMAVRPELAGSITGLSGALAIGGGTLMATATGAAVSAFDAVPTVLAMILVSGGISLVAALAAWRFER